MGPFSNRPSFRQTASGRSLLLVFALIAFQRGHATTCAGATVLNPASLPITNQALVCGATNDLNSTNVPGNLCGSNDNAAYKNGNEALYVITPTVTGAYNINVTGQTWSSVQVWAGCPNGGGTCVYGDGNAANTTTITATLNAGTQYYIWFDTWPTPASPCPGTFSIGPAPPPPANDNPCGATPLTAGLGCTFQGSTTASSTATTGPPAPTCAFYSGSDVWFSVVVPASGVLILDSNTGVILDGGMALYTATACNGTFTQVACDDDASANGAMPYIYASGLTPGTTVYVRFWEYGGDNNGTFSICAYTIPPPPPMTGDDPCAANPLPVLASCIPLTYSNIGATATAGPPAPGCGLYTGGDIWFSFTAPANGVVTIETAIGTMTNGAMELYSAPSCAGPFTSIQCNDDAIGLMPRIDRRCTPLTPGQTYYLRVWGYNGQQGSFNICAFQSTTTNTFPEDCSGGTTICNNLAFNNNTNNTGCTADLNAGNQGCLASGERQGTWYYFSPSAAGTIGFTINPAAPTDYDFAVWGPMASITCPPVGAPLRCSFAAPTGPTGCGNGATDFTEGAGGDRWVSTFNVLVGQIYILYVDNFSANGQQFSLDWNLTNGASLDCTVLPLELISLTAQSVSDHVLISWETATEMASDHFIVERSPDGSDFTLVGSLPAAGNSQAHMAYHYRDLTPLQGLNYYRLVEVDAHGHETRVATTTAIFRSAGAEGPFPNPTSGAIRLVLEASGSDHVELAVIDAMGRTVFVRTFFVGPGPSVLDLTHEGLPAGSYTLRLTAGSGQPRTWPLLVY